MKPLGLVSREEAVAARRRLAEEGRPVVFTNGVFDLLHRGHVELLTRARSFGEALFVGVNTDASVRRLKGADRPWVPEADRAAVLAALRPVDAVVLFDEDTPAALLDALAPDVLVKGADYEESEIVGAERVRARGGRVERVPLIRGRSTSALVREIARRGPGTD